jgi:hypothetical protein
MNSYGLGFLPSCDSCRALDAAKTTDLLCGQCATHEMTAFKSLLAYLQDAIFQGLKLKASLPDRLNAKLYLVGAARRYGLHAVLHAFGILLQKAGRPSASTHVHLFLERDSTVQEMAEYIDAILGTSGPECLSTMMFNPTPAGAVSNPLLAGSPAGS